MLTTELAADAIATHSDLREFEQRIRAEIGRIWKQHGYGEVPAFPYEPDWWGMMQMDCDDNEHATELWHAFADYLSA